MELIREEERILLELAREVIMALPHDPLLNPEQLQTPGLGTQRGAFVTIKRHGRLRGCLGSFSSDRPLWQEIASLARAAATSDPRFLPMGEEEKLDFTLEISVLSPLRAIVSVEEIVVGRHGIVVEQGFRRGVLLPQVASDYGWDRQTFLEQTCLKAGLPPAAWEAASTRLQIFSAQIFGEE